MQKIRKIQREVRKNIQKPKLTLVQRLKKTVGRGLQIKLARKIAAKETAKKLRFEREAFAS